MKKNKMGLFRSMVFNYRTIIKTVSSYTTHLPPQARYRLATWLVFETIMRKPGRPPAWRQVSRSAQEAIEAQVALYAGYMVIFAHDDAADPAHLGGDRLQRGRLFGLHRTGKEDPSTLTWVRRSGGCRWLGRL